MGYRHYKAMLMQATVVDCRALDTFIDLLTHTNFDNDHGVSSFWDSMDIDRVMDCARKITRIHGEFIGDMKLLLASGCVEVKARNKVTGEIFKIEDTEVFNLDVPIVDIKFFHHVLVDASKFTKGNSINNN